MNNYNIVTDNERNKYHIIYTIRQSGAVLTGVSGYGSGYYIQFDATQHSFGNGGRARMIWILFSVLYLPLRVIAKLTKIYMK